MTSRKVVTFHLLIMGPLNVTLSSLFHFFFHIFLLTWLLFVYGAPSSFWWVLRGVGWLLDSTSSKKVYYYCCKYPGCHYKTIRSGHLKRHERIHTKEKPYKCHLCSYTAARSDHLRRHIKIHFKDVSASNSLVTDEQPGMSVSSVSSSPAASPSPILSASSSPTLQPSMPESFAPYDSLDSPTYEEGGLDFVCVWLVVIVFLNFLRQCYQNQRF